MKPFDETTLDEARKEAGFCKRNLQHRRCTLAHAGRFYEALSDARRTAGVLELLLHADAAAFARELAHSGYARRHFLRRCASASYADHYVCSGRADALFDALAGGYLAIAREIAALSPDTLRPGEEYEEDFWYARFLHGLIAEPPSPAGNVLKQLDGAGGSSARLALCKALDARDQAGFDQAFEALLEERDEAVNEARLGLAQEEGGAAACTYVFIEGLAVLWLADRAGLVTRNEYRHCPALARRATGAAPPADELP